MLNTRRTSVKLLLVLTALITAPAILLWASPPARGPAFRRHDINPQSNYSACAAVDVNGDGRLDIVAGGWWYEAPTWKSHFAREVEMIRGRYDDYSNLPLDVDGDGWTDLISANFRSRSLYWVRHPGPAWGSWKKFVIDIPGPMETGRLFDVNGDGQLDVLPNGTNFAAWWELSRKKDQNGNEHPLWVRHDLPVQAAGHGVGFGDIDGDGRGDVVGPRGWLQAPADSPRGEWIWRPEFQLHRDSSIPILVHDADGDGDSDLIWGRGHNTGLYWLEQKTDPKGRRHWILHAIDTSWSQAHSLLLADIDNDGQVEVIAGKRYLGHDGKDLGEYDPLVIYWYRFDSAQRTWQRGTISGGGPAGLGVDPKAVDLDGDGDLDILASDLSGLYWFENLLIGGPVSPHAERPPFVEYDHHEELLVYKDDQRKLHPVRSAADWAVRRSHILSAMEQVLGRLPGPSQRVPLDIEILEEVEKPKYSLQRITYAAEPGDRVSAYLLLPRGIEHKVPGMLCLHQTTKIGKKEPAGLEGNPTLHYAHELAERGYVCIVPDYPSFGDYRYDFDRQGRYASGSMKAVWNNVRAIDVLESLPQVDQDRIGCIGHSLGGHNGLFTAAFDLRLRAVATSCGFTAFHHYHGGRLEGWTSDRYMPRIRDVYRNDPDLVPFDFHEVLAALVPRAVFINAPVRDDNFDIAGVRKVISAVAQVYALLGAGEGLKAVHPDSGHHFPDSVRQQVYEWLDQKFSK